LFAENPDGRLKGRHWLVPTPSLRNEAKKLAVLSIQSMIELEFQQQGILKAPEAAGQKRLVENGARMGIASLNYNSLHANSDRNLVFTFRRGEAAKLAFTMTVFGIARLLCSPRGGGPLAGLVHRQGLEPRTL